MTRTGIPLLVYLIVAGLVACASEAACPDGALRLCHCDTMRAGVQACDAREWGACACASPGAVVAAPLECADGCARGYACVAGLCCANRCGEACCVANAPCPDPAAARCR